VYWLTPLTKRNKTNKKNKTKLSSMKPNILITLTLLVFAFANCKKSDYKGNGWAVFYTNSNKNGTITLTVHTATFNLPITNNPDSYCTSGYTGAVLLDVGTYNYTATGSGGKKWNGVIEITKGNCIKILVQ
jgi:hypothetical protein